MPHVLCNVNVSQGLRNPDTNLTRWFHTATGNFQKFRVSLRRHAPASTPGFEQVTAAS